MDSQIPFGTESLVQVLVVDLVRRELGSTIPTPSKHLYVNSPSPIVFLLALVYRVGRGL